ncbi:MAG TPA: chaperone modulator CbpM [bacterium]|nr:chaperone modulator CbpM [bacterium]
MPGYEIQVLVEMTGLDELIIVECVQREVVHARTAEAGRLFLDDSDLARLRRIHRLMTDFDIGLDAVELILSLQDEINRLRDGSPESRGT